MHVDMRQRGHWPCPFFLALFKKFPDTVNRGLVKRSTVTKKMPTWFKFLWTFPFAVTFFLSHVRGDGTTASASAPAPQPQPQPQPRSIGRSTSVTGAVGSPVTCAKRRDVHNLEQCVDSNCICRTCCCSYLVLFFLCVWFWCEGKVGNGLTGAFLFVFFFPVFSFLFFTGKLENSACYFDCSYTARRCVSPVVSIHMLRRFFPCL